MECYVSPQGNLHGDGSHQAPFPSLALALNHVAAAQRSPEDEATIFLRGGSYDSCWRAFVGHRIQRD